MGRYLPSATFFQPIFVCRYLRFPVSCKPRCRQWKATSAWSGSFLQPKDTVHGTKTKDDCQQLSLRSILPALLWTRSQEEGKWHVTAIPMRQKREMSQAPGREIHAHRRGLEKPPGGHFRKLKVEADIPSSPFYIFEGLRRMWFPGQNGKGQGANRSEKFGRNQISWLLGI